MKFFDKGELRVLWPFYLDALLSPMLFFAPAFMIIYFLGLNLSLFQIGILMTMSPIASLLFEIPTGAIADLYGRKFSVLLGYFLEGISLLLLFFVKDYYSILLIFAFSGIAVTFSSGAKEAWVVDLIKNKNKRLVHSYFSKSQSFDAFAVVVSGIIGSLFVKFFGLSVIWIIGFFSYILAVLILLFASEMHIRKKFSRKDSFSNLKKQSIISLKYARHHPVILYLFIGLFFSTIAFLFGEYLSFVPFLKSLGFPDYAFGYFWSAIWALMIIAPLLSRTFMKKGKEIKLMIWATIIGSLILLLTFFAKNYAYALIVIFFSLFFYGLQNPVSRTYFHKFIPNKLRATIGSIRGMISSLGGIIGLPLGGYLIDLIGARYVIIISALLAIPTVIFYLKIKESKKRG